MNALLRLFRHAASIGPALFVSLHALPVAAAGLSAIDRSTLLQSGLVGSAVADALQSEDRVRVMVVFSVPRGRAERGDDRFPTPRVRGEIVKAADRLLGRFSPGEFQIRRRYTAINALAGSISAGGLLRLAADPAVVRVDLDQGGSGHLAQAVPLVGLDALHASGLTGQGVQVAVLDTGVDLAHPDTGDAVIAERCFCSGGGGCCPDSSASQSGAGSAQDDHGHGTNVAGVVTSDGDVAPVGGAPDTDIVAIKVMDSSNSFCCTSDVVAGLDWIINDRPDVDIVNMSLGTFALFGGDCDNANASTMAFASAIDTLRSNGVLTFVSSGNQGSGTQMPAPACIANAISVGAVWDSNVGSRTILGCTDATTAADQVTCFSNSNSKTDLFAPGAPTTSAGLGGGTSTFYGTSQASPLVAACAAVLLEANPSLTPDQLELALEISSVVVTDATNGLGFPRLECTPVFRVIPVPGLAAWGVALVAALLAGGALWTLRRES